MGQQKIIYDICEASRQWHLPIFAGFLGLLNTYSRETPQSGFNGLGDVPGDNILSKEILVSLSSRRRPRGRLSLS